MEFIERKLTDRFVFSIQCDASKGKIDKPALTWFMNNLPLTKIMPYHSHLNCIQDTFMKLQRCVLKHEDIFFKL